MTRAAEFCYIAEADSKFLCALAADGSSLWTTDPEKAIRISDAGRQRLAMACPVRVGFRKILVG
jgi:hypothetical protein